MAIVRETNLYELLIRFTDGVLTGAHQMMMHTVRDDETGEVYKRDVADPTPIQPEAIAGLMDAQIPVMAAQIAALESDLAQANELTEGQARDIARMAARVAELEAQIQAAAEVVSS